MAGGITNWAVAEQMGDKSAENKALDKVKKFEKKRIKEGWRYVKVGGRTELLVPCDKRGKPTAEGLRRISDMEILLGIDKKR